MYNTFIKEKEAGMKETVFCESTSVTALDGVGERRAAMLEKLGIRTLGDLVSYYPRAYEKRGDVRLLGTAPSDTPAAFLLTVATEVSVVMIRRGLTIAKFRAFDESGSVSVVFFNAPYIKDIFHTGSVFRFYGALTYQKKLAQLVNPKYEPYLEGVPLPDFVPIYSLTAGISSKILASLVRSAFDKLLPTFRDPLPEDIRLAHALPTLTYAIENAHFPSTEDALTRAVRRLAFDEMFLFALGIARTAKERTARVGITLSPCRVDPFLALLPYELTASQKAAVNDIYRDLTRKNEEGVTPPMSRVLVGDVGSGKTVCAALAAYFAAKAGYQTALMAPTEILARQHAEDLTPLFEKLGFQTELLLGSTTAKEKRRIYEAAASGEATLLIGTHALLSDKLNFSSLGLVITDEQHRFGVLQRAALRGKSEAPHLLVMSATPIPRTLALAMYGDLDVSRITELPKGRQRVDTFVVNEGYRDRLNAFIQKQAESGGQCYIVCPSIEPSEEEEDAVRLERIGDGMVPERDLHLKNVVEYTTELKKALPTLTVETLHGKMRPAEKDEIMLRFSKGEIDVLVSTTVIEVGVNVPNASLMIVENAERFGLSQLHQLRGRVGRGTRKSYCVLVSDAKGEAARERLETMRKTYDGFAIAEKDLMLRGPGDFFSSNQADNFRQSGGFSFRFANLSGDSSLFTEAFSAAKELLSRDAALTSPDNALLAELLNKRILSAADTIS